MIGKKFFKKLIILSFIVVFAVLLMTVIDKSSLKMAYAYYTLTNKPSRSDLQFNVPTGRITFDRDGSKAVTFEISQEISDTLTSVTDEDTDGADVDEDTQ